MNKTRKSKLSFRIPSPRKNPSIKRDRIRRILRGIDFSHLLIALKSDSSRCPYFRSFFCTNAHLFIRIISPSKHNTSRSERNNMIITNNNIIKQVFRAIRQMDLLWAFRYFLTQSLANASKLIIAPAPNSSIIIQDNRKAAAQGNLPDHRRLSEVHFKRRRDILRPLSQIKNNFSSSSDCLVHFQSLSR